MKDLDNLYTRFIPQIYGSNKEVMRYQTKRYENLIKDLKEKFGNRYFHVFSTPGRTEIGGNHTDHNNGRVLAGAINRDSIAAATRTFDHIVTLYSEGYDDPFVVCLSDLEKNESEQGTTLALIRGIACGLKTQGYKIGGFSACMTSDLLAGSGLSSSASVEVLIGTIFNTLYNQNKIEPVVIARIGQFAENEFFGKPCGLMDQITCVSGGIVAIDFRNPENPDINKINFNLNDQNYSLVVLNSGDNHAGLTAEYTSIPEEMRIIAQNFDKTTLRELSIQAILNDLPRIRKNYGDRAVLRALHYFNENERVERQVDALKHGQFDQFLKLINASGNSSFKWLQNVYSSKNASEQGVSIALALSELFLKEIGAGACRVHGGGFAGTIQVYLPSDKVQEYKDFIEPIFGSENVLILEFRETGSVSFGEYSQELATRASLFNQAGKLLELPTK